MTDPKPGLDRTELVTLVHELRGALTVISGYGDLLRRPLDEESRAQALEGIERAVARADRLLEEALLGDGAGEERRDPLDLTLLAERVADEQRAATGREVEVVAAGPAFVRGDTDALARLLGNLVDNAAKYSAARTPVEIEVRASETTVALTVLDRGPGIAEHDRERAFALFERLGAEGGAVEGTGVGLAVVAEVAARHGGSVRIEDREGGGAAIGVELPAL